VPLIRLYWYRYLEADLQGLLVVIVVVVRGVVGIVVVAVIVFVAGESNLAQRDDVPWLAFASSVMAIVQSANI
jgi:hypothetical protein